MKKNLLLMTITFSLLSFVMTAQVKHSGAKKSTGVKKSSNTNSKYGTFTDARDGHVYKTVKIGTQTWMAENLAYEQPSESETPCKNHNVLYRSSRPIDDGFFTDYEFDMYSCGKLIRTLFIFGHENGGTYFFETKFGPKEKYTLLKFEKGYYLGDRNYTTNLRDAIAYKLKEKLDKQEEQVTVPGISIYENNYNYGKTYGFLYTWEAAKAACPPGWHLPSDEEWKKLEISLGMSQTDAEIRGYRGKGIGTKLKSTSGWVENGNGNNQSGFNALPAGYRSAKNHSFFDVGRYAYFWSSSPSDKSAWVRYLNYSLDGEIIRLDPSRAESYSIRCLKD